MGDRYEFSQKCPKCFNKIRCYYAESAELTTTKCANCGTEFRIILDFKLEELSFVDKEPKS